MKKWMIAFAVVVSFYTKAQIVSGPMLGHTDLRTAIIWVHFDATVKEASVKYKEPASSNSIEKSIPFSVLQGGEFNIGTATLTSLMPGSSYNYTVMVNQTAVATGTVKTQELWQWRKNPPEFSFITGSCTYMNEPPFDRPGKPYGYDSSILETMAKENADFMLWLGDNWYTREVDYFSEWGLHYRPAHERAMPVYKNLLKKMPHYAIWDDHDYGWNDGDKSYPLKETSRNVFKKFWANPSYGENGQGIFTKFTWNDVDVFLLDDRWFRSNDEMADSINGKPNTNKRMYGQQQLEWLKNALLQSNSNGSISFRIIATGSQVLNPMSPFDCFNHFSVEYKELMDFIADNKINGLLFLTGDRHHSEIIKVQREGAYPLYDITSSPITSGSHMFGGPEKNNPYRVVGVENTQNYARVTITGPRNARAVNVEFIDKKGIKLANWSVTQKEISYAKEKK